MKNNILKHGIIGAAIVCTVMIAMTWYMKNNPDYEPSAIIGLASMFFAHSFVLLGIKKERDHTNGIISFGKAFRTGVGISLLISTIYVIVWLIIYYNFFPEFMDRYADIVLRKTKPEELAAKTAEMNQMKEWYKNPFYVVLLTFIEILPIGIVVSLIGALLFKKNKM